MPPQSRPEKLRPYTYDVKIISGLTVCFTGHEWPEGKEHVPTRDSLLKDIAMELIRYPSFVRDAIALVFCEEVINSQAVRGLITRNFHPMGDRHGPIPRYFVVHGDDESGQQFKRDMNKHLCIMLNAMREAHRNKKEAPKERSENKQFTTLLNDHTVQDWIYDAQSLLLGQPKAFHQDILAQFGVFIKYKTALYEAILCTSKSRDDRSYRKPMVIGSRRLQQALQKCLTDTAMQDYSEEATLKGLRAALAIRVFYGAEQAAPYADPAPIVRSWMDIREGYLKTIYRELFQSIEEGTQMPAGSGYQAMSITLFGEGRLRDRTRDLERAWQPMLELANALNRRQRSASIPWQRDIALLLGTLSVGTFAWGMNGKTLASFFTVLAALIVEGYNHYQYPTAQLFNQREIDKATRQVRQMAVDAVIIPDLRGKQRGHQAQRPVAQPEAPSSVLRYVESVYYSTLPPKPKPRPRPRPLPEAQEPAVMEAPTVITTEASIAAAIGNCHPSEICALRGAHNLYVRVPSDGFLEEQGWPRPLINAAQQPVIAPAEGSSGFKRYGKLIRSTIYEIKGMGTGGASAQRALVAITSVETDAGEQHAILDLAHAVLTPHKPKLKDYHINKDGQIEAGPATPLGAGVGANALRHR